MMVGKFLMSGLILLMSEITLAAVEVKNPTDQNGNLLITKEVHAELQLKAMQAPLSKVLNNIARQTGVRINYSVLPGAKVTATCVGSTLRQVLECLLVGKADLVFRYAQAVPRENESQPLEEVWVVTAKPDAGMMAALVHSPVEVQQHLATKPEKTDQGTEPDQTDALLKMADSNLPAERVEAMGRLLAGGRKGDVAVKETLVAALADPDAMVRVRALSSLAHREGAGASAALHQALHDSDVSVRLTAVDNAGHDETILQQALTDSDANVRQLAEIRLKRLEKADVVF